MAFSNLYSAVCRGKWFVSFREVESNLLVVDKLLERDFDSQDTGRLSEREAIPLMIATKDGRSARLGNSFSDAPQGSTAIIPVHGTMLKYGTYCSYGTTEYAALIRDAADSANISSVLCDIDSGGGAVDAIAPLVDAILYAKSKGKAVVAHCDLCASAAYYNPQIQISAESETKRSIFRKRDKTKRSKKESAQHSKSRNKSFVMTSVSAL